MGDKKEAIRRFICWGLSIIGVVLLLGLSAYGQDGRIAKVEIIPPHPTPNDNISIRLFGTWPDSCVPQHPLVGIAGNNIFFATSNPGEVCLQVISSFDLTVPIGRLPAGTYQVIATHHFPGGQIELGREVFTVFLQRFTGRDDTGNFQRALEDAVRKAIEAVPCCDRLITYQVVETRGKVGGIAGFNTIEVTILATWD